MLNPYDKEVMWLLQYKGLAYCNERGTLCHFEILYGPEREVYVVYDYVTRYMSPFMFDLDYEKLSEEYVV